MNNWEKALIGPDASIREALSIINAARSQFVMVVDPKRVLLGTLSDGDIRRSLLAGATLETPINRWICSEPTVANESQTDEEVLALMRSIGVHQIPIIDELQRVVNLKTVDEFLYIKSRENPVVIMAGGLGSRLNELTLDRPKPMLPLGGKPILEMIINRFVSQGFTQLWIAVNFKSDGIENYFGDGQNFGVSIKYLREGKRLGTAGALSLLPKNIAGPILVTNADIVANIDYGCLIETHLSSSVIATMAVREHEYQIPFGVVVASEGKIQQIDEKPTHRVMVNAGVYALSIDALALVPRDTFFDMPQLFNELISSGGTLGCHLIRGYWLDIGQRKEYDLANAVFDALHKVGGQ